MFRQIFRQGGIVHQKIEKLSKTFVIDLLERRESGDDVSVTSLLTSWWRWANHVGSCSKLATTSFTFFGASKQETNGCSMFFASSSFVYMRCNLVDVEIRQVKVYSNQIDSWVWRWSTGREASLSIALSQQMHMSRIEKWVRLKSSRKEKKKEECICCHRSLRSSFDETWQDSHRESQRKCSTTTDRQSSWSQRSPFDTCCSRRCPWYGRRKKHLSLIWQASLLVERVPNA